MRNSLFISALVLFTLSACSYDEIRRTDALDEMLLARIADVSPTKSVDHYILPNERSLDEIPQDVKNPLNPAKIALGMYLFFETGIAVDAQYEEGRGTYSCGTCHVPSAGFRPGAKQGIADGGLGFGVNGEERVLNPAYQEDEIDAQGARPLTVLNVAFVTNTFWNGQFGAKHANVGTEHLWNEEEMTIGNELGFEAIETQNFEGMDVHRMNMTPEMAVNLGYKELFDIAFKEYPVAERYTKTTASLALSAYIRQLLTNKAPFQRWLKGEYTVMSEQEKRGAMLFFTKANCYSCHTGPSFSAVKFYALGVNDLHMNGGLKTDESDRRNLGRGGFTKEEEDMFKFKVPQLYNLKTAPFYFHGSSKETLMDVIDYFNKAIPENPNVPESQIAPNFRPINLTEQEKEDLHAFIADALYDPYLDRYVPPYVKSGQCFPNNDPVSIEDTGCK